MSDGVPVNQLPKANTRLSNLVSAFTEKYGGEPSYVVRAPGRVNLIGEHIDYMGYGVLPMAIEQDIVIAGRLNKEPTIRLCNFDSKYQYFECNTSSENLKINTTATKWYNYFMCGYRGVTEHLKLPDDNRQGLELMVSGSIPPSAGLSSSSAFVCASALITSALYSSQVITKTEYAQICCDCERYVGTQGGGMDQSISFLAELGKAKMIDFNPIRATDVKLPDGHVFVISHSLAELNKAATSDFNQRVVECRLACQILANKFGKSWRDYRRLGDLQKDINKSFNEMLLAVEQHLHAEPYTKSEICDILSVTSDELDSTTLSANTRHIEVFMLHQRAKHVFSEASRVLAFKAICDSNDGPNTARLLGELMNASHASTKDLYECSHPDLDALVETCLSAGALGSRLTGAGWGGCAVSLVAEDVVSEFLADVKSSFYTENRLAGRPIEQVIFKSSPAAGACIYKI